MKKKSLEEIFQNLLFLLPGLTLIPGNSFTEILQLTNLIICIVMVFKNKFRVTNRKVIARYFIFATLLCTYILLNTVFDIKYMKSKLLYLTVLSFLFLITGNSFKRIHISSIKLNIIFSSLLGVSIYIKFLRIIDLSNTQYMVHYKNSLGPVLAFSIMIYFAYFQKLKKNNLFLVLTLFNYLILFFMKNRTGLLATTIALVFLNYRNIKFFLKSKLSIGIFGLILISLPFKWKSLINYIEWGLGFTHKRYNTSFIDILTSSRHRLFLEAFEVIKEHPLRGNGYFYVDNLYLNLVANYGIIGLFCSYMLVIFFIKNYSSRKNSINRIKIMKNSLVFYVLISSLLEGYSPLGPGLTYQLYWIYFGINPFVKEKK